MSTLYITEYIGVGVVGRFAGSAGLVAMAEEPGTDQSPITISGTAAQSTAFASTTKFIRVHTDAICSILVGNNPTATTSNKRLAANQTEYFAVPAGMKLSVIANT